jgi:hypothetical protein
VRAELLLGALGDAPKRTRRQLEARLPVLARPVPIDESSYAYDGWNWTNSTVPLSSIQLGQR